MSKTGDCYQSLGVHIWLENLNKRGRWEMAKFLANKIEVTEIIERYIIRSEEEFYLHNMR